MNSPSHFEDGKIRCQELLARSHTQDWFLILFIGNNHLLLCPLLQYVSIFDATSSHCIYNCCPPINDQSNLDFALAFYFLQLHSGRTRMKSHILIPFWDVYDGPKCFGQWSSQEGKLSNMMWVPKSKELVWDCHCQALWCILSKQGKSTGDCFFNIYILYIIYPMYYISLNIIYLVRDEWMCICPCFLSPPFFWLRCRLLIFEAQCGATLSFVESWWKVNIRVDGCGDCFGWPIVGFIVDWAARGFGE